ncbi:M20 family metallopeptidase [Hespellia stercorisuis]|uniref:Peptidase M20 domain-containing protein 2 n=1 Tax=Hespellia stercorisuis DSM 15480 TaxID=1121950 RepID=A0A1M6M8A0_9FIRM|nr:M20 family metallopeptidase [Hespellia stercorisuis]SHJ79698.1 amidohydrolase [Hespellia stercorisuis DSM 15480]
MYCKNKAIEEIEKNRTEITELCEYIFENPELGFQEFKSSRALKEFLEKHGFTVEMGVAGLETAFRAEKRGTGEGPVVGFLCEYDALPNGHSCGHNIIASSAVMGAVGLADGLGEYAGNIVVLGTPSEEGSGGGKELLYQAGIMDDLDCAMMFHPGPKTVINDILLAIAAYSFTFHGKPAHAGACPDKGISAVEAVVQMFNNVNGMRVTTKPSTRVHGIIKQGGAVTNVIPDLTEAQFGIRAVTKEELNELVERVKNCARGAALSTGCTVDIKEIGVSYMDLINSEVLLKLVEKNLADMGEQIDVRDATEGLGSSDVGNISHRIPTFQVMISVNSPAVPHTEAFAEACKGEKGADIAIRAAKALAMTGVDIFNDSAIVADAKRELEQKSGER